MIKCLQQEIHSVNSERIDFDFAETQNCRTEKIYSFLLKFFICNHFFTDPVDWGCWYTDCISAEGKHCLNECYGNDTKQSDGEIPVVLELWGIQSIPFLKSPPKPLSAGVVAHDRVLCLGQIQLNRVIMLNWIVWNRAVLHLTDTGHWPRG